MKNTETKSKAEKEARQPLKVSNLKEIKICKNIKNRNPVGIGEIFQILLTLYTALQKIENLGKKMEVRHIWYYEKIKL